jgi:hypothetical protein
VRGGLVGETLTWRQDRTWRCEKNGEQNRRAANLSSFSSLDLWRICCNARPEGRRASIRGRYEQKKEKFRVVIRQAKGRAFRMHCNIVRMNGPSLHFIYGPLTATPKSTGWSAGVVQRQPLSVFRNANAFSIRSLRATEKPSLITHDGFS